MTPCLSALLLAVAPGRLSNIRHPCGTPIYELILFTSYVLGQWAKYSIAAQSWLKAKFDEFLKS